MVCNGSLEQPRRRPAVIGMIYRASTSRHQMRAYPVPDQKSRTADQAADDQHALGYEFRERSPEHDAQEEERNTGNRKEDDERMSKHVMAERAPVAEQPEYEPA